MCNFKPGDEVAFIQQALWDGEKDLPCPPPEAVFICLSVAFIETERCEVCGSTAVVTLNDDKFGVCPCVLRKVQRQDLSAWLKTSVPSTDHLDKPLPAKKRERVE